MLLSDFTAMGCCFCGGTEFDQPLIPPISDSNPLPITEPFIRCIKCKNEFTFEVIQGMEKVDWEYERNLASVPGSNNNPNAKTTVYEDEAQFDPEFIKLGFVPGPVDDLEESVSVTGTIKVNDSVSVGVRDKFTSEMNALAQDMWKEFVKLRREKGLEV